MTIPAWFWPPSGATARGISLVPFGAGAAQGVGREQHLEDFAVRMIQRAHHDRSPPDRGRHPHQRFAVGKAMQLYGHERSIKGTSDLPCVLRAVGERVNLQSFPA